MTYVKAWKDEILTITFSAETVRHYAYNALNNDMKDLIKRNGFAKIWDAYSKNNGAADAASKADAVWEMLLEGNWKKPRAGVVRSNKVLLAMINISENDEATVRATWDSWDKKQQAAAKTDSRVLKELARMAMEAAESMEGGESLEF